MNKSLLAFAAATSIAVSLLAAPPPAQARCFGCAVGAGIVGGVIAGAIVGSAVAPVGCPGGYWARRPVAFDAYGNPIGWSRPRFFCP